MPKTPGMYGAIAHGDTAMVHKLIAENPQILKEYFQNQTWLQMAAEDGNIEIMKVLVDAGAPVDQLTEDGTDTTLDIAAGQGEFEACKWLFDHAADVNHGLGKVATPIFSAIYSKSLKMVELFVERGADLTATFGPPPRIDVIRFAEDHGTPEIVSFLKKRLEHHG